MSSYPSPDRAWPDDPWADGPRADSLDDAPASVTPPDDEITFIEGRVPGHTYLSKTFAIEGGAGPFHH